MSKARIVEIERHLLADGSVVTVSRLGRRHYFSRLYPNPEDHPPKTGPGITKAEAYRLLEDALKRDVLDLD